MSLTLICRVQGVINPFRQLHIKSAVLQRCRKLLHTSSAFCAASSESDQLGSESRPTKDREQLFINADVQRILRKITGFNINKIFHDRQMETTAPKYKLLTDKQLQAFQEEAVKKAHKRLQMPPVKNAWTRDKKSDVLSADADIAGFDTCKYVITDISYGLPNRHRTVVVRDVDGVLRLANHEERDRILQVYYPQPGKMYTMPKMFAEENLERVLTEQRYEYVLDRACVQFEPDDPEFIRVTERTYEHIKSTHSFDVMRSTRHFGPMAFYFAFHRNIDLLLTDMLQRDLLTDAADLVKVYHIIHPESTSATQAAQQGLSDPQQIIQLFTKHDSQQPAVLELALQSYNDAHQQTRSTA